MQAQKFHAAILVTLAAFVLTSSQSTGTAAQAVRDADKVAELWQPPHDIATRDLFHGPGGAELMPKHDTPFTWLATDATGYSPGFDVRGHDSRKWSVKLGPEAQTEVVASRILWAIGYHQPPNYFVKSWHLSGGPGGPQTEARFRTDFDGSQVIGDWSWKQNEFLDTQPFRGLIVANILLNSWDWKTSNNKIYRHADGARRFVVRDLGASLGKTSGSKLLWTIPIRGFGQGTRNDIEGFESQGFIKQVGENDVEFDFDTIYGSVVDLVRPADVKWTAELLSRITDAQWDDAFRAAHYTPEIRARFIKKIKAKIAEGLAVS
jgi:hypothetical protein